MEYALTVVAKFEASHQVDIPGCERGDGHSWVVRATVEAPLQPTPTGVRRVGGEETLHMDLVILARELNGRHLNDMLAGVALVPEGIAAWFLERLGERVTSVEVEMGPWQSGRATRTKR